MEQAWMNAVHGGLLIGLAAALMLVLNGRILGVSGIVHRIYAWNKNDTLWRILRRSHVNCDWVGCLQVVCWLVLAQSWAVAVPVAMAFVESDAFRPVGLSRPVRLFCLAC